MAKTREKKQKQGWIEGMQPETIQEINDAADRLADVRGERMRLTAEEATAASSLILLMKRHRKKVYEYGEGRRVEIKGTEKVSVKRAKDSDDGEGVTTNGEAGEDA